MTDKQAPVRHDILRQDAARRDRLPHRWEHMQVDVPDDLTGLEHLMIHRFQEPELDLVAEIREGIIVDFRLDSQEVVDAEPIPPPFTVETGTSDEPEHSPVFRSWRIPAHDLTIHVESWAERDGGGFVDVFGRRRR